MNAHFTDDLQSVERTNTSGKYTTRCPEPGIGVVRLFVRLQLAGVAAKETRSAVQNAASITGLLLTMDVLIAEASAGDFAPKQAGNSILA